MKPSTSSLQPIPSVGLSALPTARAWATLLALLVPTTAAAQRTQSAAPPPEASAVWLEEVGAGLQALEQRFSPVEGEPGTWSAPNRAHELRSRVSARGLEVFPRGTGASGADAPWKLSLATSAFGRLGDAQALLCRGASAAEERAELDHGLLVEWFENSERGIEQGWTIARRPAGIDELAIELAVSGDLALRIDEGGRSGVFVDGAGEPRLRYSDLLVLDATGRELPARLEPGPAGVVIRVDDAQAVYPLTVDPLLTNPSWIEDSDQVGAQFGYSVSTAGDVNADGYCDVIVGAPHYDNGQVDEGRAFVYHGSATGLSASAAWTAESNRIMSGFGAAVATAGDVNGDGYSDVIVGAPWYTNGEDGEGRAYVYHGSANGLAANPAWSIETNWWYGQFGHSVATAGDVNGDGYSDVIVGALLYATALSDEGRAFVYHGSPSGLLTSVAWSAGPAQAGAHFGASVSTAGDVNRDGYDDVIVGAPRYDNGLWDTGRAFVYHGSAAGLAASPAWTAESSQFLAQFGNSVSTAGDVNGDGFADVIVGARLYDGLHVNEGRAYLYLGSGSGLAASASWVREGGQAEAYFGTQVGTAGDVNGDGRSDVIVGAAEYDNGQTNEGRAFVYHGNPTGLSTSPSWTRELNQAGAVFGFSVALAGDVNADGYSDVIVGAPLFDFPQAEEGGAFVHHGSAGSLVSNPAWSVSTSDVNVDFGWSVSTAGDVNGDGYSDVVVGVPEQEPGLGVAGRAHVYHGSASGLATSPAWTVSQVDAMFGWSVSTAGDVNGDGYSDLIVGAPAWISPGMFGRALVYHGSASGLALSPAWTAGSSQGEFFGCSVSTAGDVNGDGYSDVIVGSSRYDNGQTDEGRVSVYLGSAFGLGTSAAWTAEANLTDSEFGTSVSTAGDVNRDGYSDVIVGAPEYNNGQGRAFVYHGSATGLGTSAAWTAEAIVSESEWKFGSSVSTAGDVNGDGFSDVIVGSPNGLAPQARVFHGSANGLLTSPASTVYDPEFDYGDLGFAVSEAGDVNGDGYSDVIVGSPLSDRAYLYLGSASGLVEVPAWSIYGGGNAYVGVSVSTAGDVNGDGYSDVLIDALGGNTVLAFHGNAGGGGLVRVLQQRTQDGARPIALLGRTAMNGLIRLRAQFPKNLARFSWASGLNPEARLEWEAKPLGVPFDGTGIQGGTPQFLEPANGTLTFDEPVGLPLGIVFHWRVRVAVTGSPLFRHTAWFSVPGNSVTEAKVRRPRRPRLP